MSDFDCHVEVVGPYIVRFALVTRANGAAELALHVSNDGLYWIQLGAAELGEATPIVAGVLRSLIDSMAKGPQRV